MNFVFDIDGTICFDGQMIAAPIVTAIDALLQRGHDVIFASARPIRDMLLVLPRHYHQLPLIGGNGAFVKQHGHITSVSFTDETKDALLQLIAAYDVTYLADSHWDYAYTGSVTHRIYKQINIAAANNVPLLQLKPLCKLVLFDPPAPLLQELATLQVVCHVHAGEQLVDISPRNIRKWHGLQQLGITDYVAFGNDVNDVCMFEHARDSICVGGEPLRATKHIARQDVAHTIMQWV